jgi:pSer/pThr/pTyr-binding forkhead associated (FHA) protein
LIVKRGDTEDVGRVFQLSKPSTVIGRSTAQYTPDIDLNDEVVSRRHAEIILRGERYLVKDLDSTNGTMLDDDRILSGSEYEMKHNSKIGLGLDGETAHVVLVFKESDSTNIIARKPGKESKAAEVAWLKVDERKKEAVVDGEAVKLSKKEYSLLLYLYENAGQVCSRDGIIDAVWPESMDPSAISDATVDQLIHRLREKVEPEPGNPRRIVSKKAFGYMLV